jgi:replication factor C subunit 3/5
MKLYNKEYKKHVIHLNASDDRGIDIIRNVICPFIYSSNTMTKFVILDEADCMTDSAQKLLKTIIENYGGNTKFCLLCNYLTKINDKLINEFILLKFNNLPLNKITERLHFICKTENIKINKKKLEQIQGIYGNDIRSMINYIQKNNKHIFDNSVFDKIIEKKSHKVIKNIGIKYNISIEELIMSFFKYVVINKDVNNLSLFITKYEELVCNLNEFNKDELIDAFLSLCCRF